MAKSDRIDTKVITGKVRLSYAHIWEKFAFKSEEPKYQAVFLIPKTATETVKAIKAAIKDAIQNGKNENVFKGKMAELDNGLRDGDEAFEDGKKGEEYKGHYYITAKSKNKPVVVDKDRDVITDQDDVYSGCYVRANVLAYPYSAGNNEGVSFFLNGVQKVADGPALTGGGSPKDFDDGYAFDSGGDEDEDDIF